jgi:hypothetical protein
MSGIDPGELTPFQGGPFIGRFPVETPGLNSRSPHEKVTAFLLDLEWLR